MAEFHTPASPGMRPQGNVRVALSNLLSEFLTLLVHGAACVKTEAYGGTQYGKGVQT
jgi:hypothetical protein